MKWRNIGLPLIGMLVAVAGVHHANELLTSKALSGSEFVWLTATYLIAGLVITVLPKVTELTFSKLTLKIAAAEQAAAVTLEQLNQALELSFAPALASITDHSGGYSDGGPRDGRLAKFFTLAQAIEKAGLRTRYAAELSDAARTIAKGQLHVIARFNDEFMLNLNPSEVLPTPETVRVEACSANGIAASATRHKCQEREALRMANEAVDAYRDIYSFTL